jgi:dihydrofolate synthase / folylpolyglutamate synthase
MNHYQDALDYLYSFINLEQKSIDRYQASKIDTVRPRRLLELLGTPQNKFLAIHIAGTKGKGSVAATCASCLRLAGLRVGLYTSPHLREFRERLRVLTPEDADGRIPEAVFADLVERVRAVVDQTPEITWFEIVTAIAFLYFAEAEVDIAVVEVGLGGRLDATNVLTPEVSVITSLSLDHTQLLGDTLSQIAYEKGGIIKPGVPVVSSPQADEALKTLKRLAHERQSPLTVIGRDWTYATNHPSTGQPQHSFILSRGPDPAFIPPGTEFNVSLAGAHQLENTAVALAALEHVWNRFPALTVATLQAGISAVHWDGRMQTLQQGSGEPTIIVDCAHNEDSVAKLVSTLHEDFDFNRLILVFGAPEDKNIGGMMSHLLPLASQVIMTTANHPRSAAPERLVELAAPFSLPITTTHTVSEALQAAQSQAEAGDLILVTGSIIVVGDLLNHWDALQSGNNIYG